MNQDIGVAIAGVMPAALSTGLFQKTTVTFQDPVQNALTPSGFPDGSFADVPGLVNIPAMVAPTSVARVSGSTQKTIERQEALNTSHVLLGGYYPAAETAWRAGARAVIGGVIYANNDVLAVESDSQQTQTRMEVRVATI